MGGAADGGLPQAGYRLKLAQGAGVSSREEAEAQGLIFSIDKHGCFLVFSLVPPVLVAKIR
jgi:hypothetical protein